MHHEGTQGPSGPYFSDDGKYYWDGQRWAPKPRRISKRLRVLVGFIGAVLGIAITQFGLNMDDHPSNPPGSQESCQSATACP
jgi:hypothetical protein